MTVDISQDLKKYIPIFQQAKEQNINEAETSLRIGKVIFFIEIKQAGIELKARHIEQASNYAANAGVEWISLTNGISWQLYHLTFDEGIQSDLIWSADILADNIQDASDKISLLHKKSISKGDLEDYYSKIVTLSPRSIMQSIFHETTLQTIRRRLRKTTGISIDEDDLVNGIKKMIAPETWEAIGDVKVKRQRKVHKSKEEETTGQEKTPSTTPQTPAPPELIKEKKEEL